MKIGFLLDDHIHRPGGIQEHVRGLYRYLERHGHQAVIFSGGSQFRNDLPERVIQLGVAIPVKGSGSWTSIPLTLRPPWALRRLLEQESCDILDVQSPFSPTLSGRLLAHSRAAHVMTFLIRIDGRLRLRLLSLAALAQRPSLRRFHWRVAISHSAVETARALYGGDHYTIIPDAVPIEEFAAAARKPRLEAFNDGRVTILFVGRLEERKGTAHLLRAFAPVERQHGAGVRLIIAGDGPERTALRRLAQELGLRHVQFMGYVERVDLPHLMASCDIFCAPAIGHESFGRVLIEAMAAGLPIVAYGNPGYAETLRAHPDNAVVPAGDIQRLSEALAAFVASASLRAEVSSRNREGAASYSWDVVGAKYLAVYEQALEVKARAEAAARRD